MRTFGAVAFCVLLMAASAQGQNRGVYPLGMSSINSGMTPKPGFTYVNQLLFYSRDHARDDDGNSFGVTGENDVLMDMNSFVWVSPKELLGANFSMVATLPVAKNSLTSDVAGDISGGSGFADSYYLPLILGWNRERFGVRAMYGFLAPTGQFNAGANDNVGSGYWTHTLSSGQTVHLTDDKRFVFSAFEMYEYHTDQKDTGIHPGDTFDLDYSLMGTVRSSDTARVEIGLVGYNARQLTAKSGPNITPVQADERYTVNAIGFAVTSAFPRQRASLGVRFFNEFANRSTYQGYSLQLSGSISF
jgi:hypothetical protein